jgi:hypothetical protein
MSRHKAERIAGSKKLKQGLINLVKSERQCACDLLTRCDERSRETMMQCISKANEASASWCDLIKTT